MHLRVTSGQFIYMSFRSEVVITRFNRRKERVNTISVISHFTKKVHVGIICNCLCYIEAIEQSAIIQM